ncbi:gliding motility-associated ABC transporter substrate-binding protein GldG [uncultured Cyclobacterium sp.]|uniref:gliding motility-associated ABC transporter substrate-binding protein GldG n=1 Tax=uncultured Cyclobacterium sp. TaxID=453820 RepID=UPI0030EB2903|tara:strand:- start:47181 stop:48860 length:1680 start_codon:yes stop_codon:yes gene_type:complete
MNRKYSSIIFGTFALVLIWFLVANLEKWYSFRVDMTEEGKYSIGQASLDVLEDMDGPLEIDVLLAGDLPPGMIRFQRNIEQILKTFRSYSREGIVINYLDPLQVASDSSERYVLKLADYGINPTNLHSTQNGAQSTQLIFPGIVLRSTTREIGVLLLKGELGMGPEETLNLSIENLEFEIGQAIKRLYTRNKRAIGIIIGQGEMDEDEGYGMVEALNEDFEVYKVPFDQAKNVEDLLTFEVLIVAGPKNAYGVREKYLLDQFLMYGGNILFLMDEMAVNLENAGGNGTVAMPFDTGLDDLLFRYGVRINKDLVQDLNFGYYPVVSGEYGNQPQIVPLPWPFYVQAGKMANHPITKGLDVVEFRFVSSIDTVKADNVLKTPLIFSSDYTRRESAPARVAFKDMANEPDVRAFNSGSLPLVYLLEGKFTSFFKNRFAPDEFDKNKFLPESNGGKILISGDADVIKSWIRPQDDRPLPLGNNPFAESKTANRTFLQNTINYMVAPNGIIASKSKSFEIRPLNKVKVKQQKSMWQVINVAMPVIVVILIGWFKQFLRKRKYAK